jgi:hypothetical protein
VFGPRPGHIFATIDDLLAWLPQPKVPRPKKIMSTEQLGFATATAWAHVRVANDQHALFANRELSGESEDERE